MIEAMEITKKLGTANHKPLKPVSSLLFLFIITFKKEDAESLACMTDSTFIFPTMENMPGIFNKENIAV